MGIDRFEMHTSHVGHDLTMRSIELFGKRGRSLGQMTARTRPRALPPSRIPTQRGMFTHHLGCNLGDGSATWVTSGTRVTRVTALMGLDARLRLAKLYLITDARTKQGDLADFLQAAFAGGVDVVRIREKDMPHEAELEVFGLSPDHGHAAPRTSSA